jgi:serine phosphatase RsbU (regulator of sigma subunit)
VATGFTEIPAALLDTLFDNAPFGLAYLDAELRYVRINDVLAREKGIAPADHIGRTPEDLLSDATQAMDALRHVLATGEPLTRDIELRMHDVPLRFAASLVPIRDGDAIAGIAVIAVEISDERTAEEQRERLFALERAARARAEAAEGRALFMAEAGTSLDGSLDLRTTLHTLARVVVPRVAHLCLVDMLNEDGTVQRLAVAHADPSREELVWELTRRWPSAADVPVGIPKVIRTGETEVIERVTDEILAVAFPDLEHREHVRALELRSAIVVPLKTRERTLGTVTIALCGPGERFTETDVSLTEELARRASLAVDNARLFTELRRADRDQRFLAEATQLLAGTLEWTEVLETVASLAIAGVADGCSIDVLDPGGEIRMLATAHVDPAKRELTEELRRRWPVDRESHYVGRALETGESALHAEIDESDYAQIARDPDQRELMRRIGVRSAMFVPMIARGRLLGAISLVITESDRKFGRGDLQLAEELARRGAVAADNARLYADRSRVARTLQRSLVPARLPEMPGMEAGVRFRSAGDGAEVGGDFYDVFAIGDGCWAAVVGDVCGKGASAAALTALARHTVRAAARYEHGPVNVLRALNRAIAEQSPELMFCTAALVWLETREGRATARVALGGHLPPVALRASGAVSAVSPPGALLGVFESIEVFEEVIELEHGDALVLYTDGVTEAGAPGSPLGEEGLSELLAAHAGERADEIAGAVEQRVGEVDDGVPRDDMAVLVLRVA